MRESERDGEKKEHLCVQVRVFVRKREIVCMCTNVCVSEYDCLREGVLYFLFVLAIECVCCHFFPKYNCSALMNQTFPLKLHFN